MERYLKFRKEYPRFFYRGYSTEETLNELKITYTFEIEGLSEFTPTWTFPKNGNTQVKWNEDPLMKKMIFSTRGSDLCLKRLLRSLPVVNR